MQERGCVTLETTVAEDDDDEPRVGRPARVPRGRAELEARARSDRDRGARGRPARGGRDRDLGGAARTLERGIYEVACEAYPDVPGEEDAAMESFEDWLSKDMQGASDRPEATFVALVGRRGGRLRQALALARATEGRATTT